MVSFSGEPPLPPPPMKPLSATTKLRQGKQAIQKNNADGIWVKLCHYDIIL